MASPHPVKRKPLTDEQRKLAEDNKGLAYEFAKRVSRNRQEFDDALGPAFEGLIRAVATYDPNTAKLSTYANYWMWNYWHRTWRFRSPVSLPLNPSQLNPSRSCKFKRELKDASRAVSIYRPTPDRKREFETLKIADTRVESAELTLDLRELAEVTRAQIESLPPREQEVVQARLQGETLKEIGARMGVSRERIRQLEEDGKRRVRFRMQAAGVIDQCQA